MQNVLKENYIKQGLIFGTAISLIDIILVVILVNTKLSFNNIEIIEFFFSLIFLYITIVTGYRIGKEYGTSKNAFYTGVIMGVVITLIAGIIVPYLESKSTNFNNAYNSFYQNLQKTTPSVIKPDLQFSLNSYISGIILSGILYGIFAWIPGLIGASKKNKEQII